MQRPARPLHGLVLHRECEGQAGADFGHRQAIHPGLAQAEIERKGVADLPDRAREHGECFRHVEFPLVTVMVVYHGADPETMESKVAEPIEEEVNTLGGIRELRSSSLEGVTQVVAMFELEVSVDQVVQDIRDRVAIASLPLLGRTTLTQLLSEAGQGRLELQVLDATGRSLRKTRSVASAGYLPRLDAFGNVYHSNPNTRIFPQRQEWSTSWDVGVQLSWTITDTLVTPGNDERAFGEDPADRGTEAAVAGRHSPASDSGVYAVREAETAIGVTARQLRAAEEPYRVRRSLLGVGEATSTELTESEAGLMKSQLDAVNAHVDLRVARASLEYALGQEPVHRGT